MRKNITKIVLTGGPCAGKTSAMSFLSSKLRELGYGVLIVSELATEIIQSGCSPDGNISSYDFEESLVLGQLEREQFYITLAHKLHNEKVVLLFDRGVVDAKAYMDEISWNSLLEDNNLSLVALRDVRYDAVIHMRTSAFGAEAFYTQENNSARREGLLEARIQDNKTLSAWIGHSHLFVINNHGDFERKVKRVYSAVLRILGEPVPIEIEKKYLVDSPFDYTTIPCEYQCIDIEQLYLPEKLRIRKRSQYGISMYTKTYKTDTDNPLIRFEEEEIISAREYRKLMKSRRVDIPPLRKQRVCFVWEEQYFELDVFKDMDLMLLEIELTEEHSIVSLPPWLPIIREVTSEINFRNVEIAKTISHS